MRNLSMQHIHQLISKVHNVKPMHAACYVFCSFLNVIKRHKLRELVDIYQDSTMLA